MEFEYIVPEEIWIKRKIWYKRDKRKNAIWWKPWMLDETKIKMEKIFFYMVYWAPEIKSEANIKRWVKPATPLLLKEAVAEVWMHQVDFHWRIDKYPEYKERYEYIRRIRMEKTKNSAEETLDAAIAWELDIDDIDRAKLSLNYLEKVDKTYNTKLQIDNNINALMLDMSEEDIKRKILELSWELW